MDELRGRQKVEIVCAVAMAASVFTPVVKAPIVGSISLMEANGGIPGALVIGLAIVAFVGAFLDSRWIPKLCAALSLLVVGVCFAGFAWKITQLGVEVERDLRGNPFKGVAKAMASAVSLSWGWILLFLSPILCLLASQVAELFLGDSRGENPYVEKHKLRREPHFGSSGGRTGGQGGGFDPGAW